MQKARLGVSVGLLGSAMYLISLFSGFLPAVVLGGYVFLCEQNVWCYSHCFLSESYRTCQSMSRRL